MNTRPHILILTGLFIFFFFSCRKELMNEKTPVQYDDLDPVEVTMKLNLPSGFPSRTRSLTELQENKVNDAYVWVFKSGVLSYVKSAERIVDGEKDKAFNVTLKASANSSDTYKLMVLINTEEWLLPIIGSDFSQLNGKTYYEVQQVLKKNGITEPMYTSGGSVVMWGELPYEEIKSNNRNFSISLLRSIARIDVGVGATDYDPVTKLASWGGLPQFMLEEVWVYKPNDGYMFVPQPNHYDENNKIVKLPTPAGNPIKTPLRYPVTGGKSIIRHIYLPEADILMGEQGKTGDANHTKRMALVVKGSYKGNASSYYRLDFINSSTKLSHVLRNHLYQFNIKSVSGNGFQTPDEAYNSLSLNMEAEVVEWNDGGIGEIAFDGQYYLGVSKGKFTLPMNQRTVSDNDNQFTVTTDFPEGWRVEKIVDEDGNAEQASWLSLSRNNGAVNTKTTVHILTDENTTQTDRIAYVSIKAGRITYKVEVTQTNKPEIYLMIRNMAGTPIRELSFLAHVDGVVPAQTFQVIWLPKKVNSMLTVSAMEGTSPFSFGSGDVINTGALIGVDGQKIFTIQPTAMSQAEIKANPFMEKSLRLNFTVSNGISYESKELFLIQKNYAAVPTLEPRYIKDGTEQFFTVNANAPWEIKVISDPDKVVKQLITTSGGKFRNRSSEKVYFKLMEDEKILLSEVKLLIKSTNSNFPFADIPVTIQCNAKTASYIINCESTVVNGIYEAGKPLHSSHTLSVNVNVSSLGVYSIVSDKVDGISFSGSGEFKTTGSHTVILTSSGTPLNSYTKNINLTSNSIGGVGMTCSVPIRMIIPKKTILSLGANGWAIHSSSGIANMFNNDANFGSTANSIFKTYRPDVKPAGSFLSVITASVLQPYLEPVSGNPVDIIIMTYSANLSGTDASNMMANYVKRGGVLIMLNENNMVTSANIGFIRTLFNNNSITGVDDVVAAGSVLKLPQTNDEILNGPFGDVRGKYIGEDQGYGDVFTNIPLSELDWYVSSVDYSGTGGNENQIFAFKARNYNFFWCGDGGVASTNGSTGYTAYPVTLTSAPNYKPSNRLYGRNTANRKTVDNAAFIANVFAWAIQQAEFNGINTKSVRKAKYR